MKKIALTVSASAFVLAAAASAGYAHWAGGPMMQDQPGGMMDQSQYGPGMMGPGMMMGGGMMGHGMMHMMIVMMDADGNGAVSLDEFQTVQARMFNAMDINKDGELTSDEMRAFMSSGGDSDDN